MLSGPLPVHDDVEPELRRRLRSLTAPDPAALRALRRRIAAALRVVGEDEQLAQGLLDRRAELKGRLTAYQAKAARLGLGEDQTCWRAGESPPVCCHRQPCDLRAVTRAVADYQQLLAEKRGERDMKCAEPGCAGPSSTATAMSAEPRPQPVLRQPPATGEVGTTVDGHAAESSPSARSAAITARSGSSRSTSTRGRLGAGIVTMPRVPKGDPAAAIMTDPQVAGGQPILRQPRMRQARRTWARRSARTHSRASAPSAARDTRSSPSFLAATSSAASTRCRAAIAHGGLGWIYLAIDRNVHNRWVVLKGLLNSGDADAMAAAAAEVLALAEVEHPNIVRIYNFVEHLDRGRAAPVGYIVMEYVGGTSLKQIRKARNGPLPPDQAVAYIIEIAPAFALPAHARGSRTATSSRTT